MSQRSAKQTMLQRKLEATYGVDPGSYVAADFALTSIPDLTPETGYESRELALPYFGATEELVAVHLYRAKYAIEMAASGVVATAPAWGRDLQACGMARRSLPPAGSNTPRFRKPRAA